MADSNVIGQNLRGNTVTISGTWKLKEDAAGIFDRSTSTNQSPTINFVSNSSEFTGITIVTGERGCVTYTTESGSTVDVIKIRKGEVEYNEEYRVVDFGSTPQTITQEFFDIFSSIANALVISGIWRLKDTGGIAPAADTEQVVAFKADGNSYEKIRFEGSTPPVSHIVKVFPNANEDDIFHLITDPTSNVAYVSILDFGEKPQTVSEEFVLWLKHMAEPVEAISGLWALKETIDFSIIPTSNEAQILNEQVYFWCDETPYTLQRFIINKEYSGSGEYNGHEIVYVDVNDGDVAVYDNVSLPYWKYPRARHIQFGETQYVTPLFKKFLEFNAIELCEGSLEPGEYCYKLDPYDAVKEFAENSSKSISILHTLARKKDDGSDPDTQYDIYVGHSSTGISYISSNTATGWQVYPDYPAQFRAFGWYQDGSSTFQNRHINVLEKTYLTYEQYQFLSRVLIPLNSQRFLDTLGVYVAAQNLKEITNLTAMYAKYKVCTPVADTLYYNTAGASSVDGLDFSKYLFVTIRSRASDSDTKFVQPTSTSFAVQNITDKDGEFILQIADPAKYVAWKITNTSITRSNSSSNSSGYLIYEIIGYRWDESILELPTPTYSYRYVKGQLSCESPQGKYFNNFYNSDGGTEFRVELNFRVNKLGVELVNNNAVNASNGLAYWKLSINKNGNLVMDNCYAGNAKDGSVTWTEFTVTPGVWYTLSLYSDNLTSTNFKTTAGQVKVVIVEYGTSYTESDYIMKGIYRWSQVSAARSLYIGGADVDLRGTILIKGTQHQASVANIQNILSVNVDNAAIGGTLSLTSNSFTLTGGFVEGATT